MKVSRAAVTAIVGVIAAGATTTGTSWATVTSSSPATKVPSGTPVVIGSIVDVTAPAAGGGSPEVKEAEEAAVKAVNASGGIQGRPLKLDLCDSMFDPNTTQSCARQLVANHAVVAVVGSVTATASPAPIFQAAKLADFGDFAFEPPDTQDSVSFPLFSPLAGAECAGSVAVKFSQPKATESGWVYDNLPGVSAQVPLIKTVLTSLHATLKNVVPLATSTSDLTPSVAAATEGATAIGVSLTPAENGQFIEAARSAGYQGGIGTLSLSSQNIKALGSFGNGVYVCEPFRPPTGGFAGGQQFLQETNSISNFAVGTDSENGWLAVRMISDAMDHLKTINRSAVLTALSKLQGASTFGFGPAYSATKPWTGAGGTSPRLMARAEYYTRIEQGTFKLVQSAPGEF